MAPRFMRGDDGAEAVKKRYPTGTRAPFFVGSLSRDLPGSFSVRALALLSSRRYISPAFPHNACSDFSARVRIRTARKVSRIHERSAIHLSHAGSDQDLSASQEGA